MINFRYRTLRKLGEGGSGEVFLVEDVLKEGRQSAMKILHGEDRSGRVADEQFRNEVSILAALRHPNLVRVSDFGMIRHSDDAALQGRRFFAMEYLQGSTAGEWWQDHRRQHDGPAQLNHFVLQALGVLSYVHQRGIIHFDIKPENIFLISGGKDDDQFPVLKLTDFGFGARLNTTLEFPLRGTLEYTAPELLRHETFDNRVDLYSLGATIYHLIEDRCPFEAGDPVELIKKVLTTEPEFHRCLDREYSSLLPLVTNLLQKDPGRRYKSAGEAARGLLENDLGAATLAIDRLPRPGFVGREKEKGVIGSAIASLSGDSEADPCVAIVVEGPEGIGKTALLSEMARVARAADVPVFEVTVSQRDLPFSGILSLLPLLRAEGMSRSVEAGALMERFADVSGGVPGVDDAAAGGLHVSWVKEKDKVVDALARWISGMSSLFPLIVIIDDAHLLDPESGEILRMASRDARSDRLLLLAAAHGEASLPVGARHVRLEELDAQSVSAMSASTLSPAELGELLGIRLHQLYGGLPALIVEALRAVSVLLPRVLPDRSPGTAELVEAVLGELPRDIDELLLARYKTIGRERQLTLGILSCFMWPARLGIIQAILPFQPQRTIAYLSSLESEGLIASHEDGQRFVMRHERLKALVYAAIGENRKESHLAVASAMEEFAGIRTVSDLQELAYQYRSGGKDAPGIHWLEAAGDEGMRIAAYRMAKELYSDAVLLAGGSPPSDCDRINIKLAQALFSCGDVREAVKLAEEQLGRISLDIVQEVTLHKTAGFAHSRLGNYEESKRHIMAGLRTSVDTTVLAELQQELVGIEIATGNFVEAERLSTAQLARAKELRNPGIIASIYNDLGIASFFQGLLDQSAGYFKEAMNIYSASRQHARVADAMMNIANVMSAKGDIVGAVEHLSDALTTSREYGSLNQQAQIQNNLGIAHFKLKRFQEARNFYDEARAIFSRLDSRKGGAYVLTNLGEVNFAEGRYEHALLLWENARRLYRDMDAGQEMVETLLQLAQVNCVVGAVESVGGNLDEAEALMNARSLETFRFRLLWLRGMHMMDLDRYDAALLFFTQSEQSPHDEAESERWHLLKVRMAECEYRMGRLGAAVTLAGQAKDSGGRSVRPQIVAEASYLLGSIAASSPSSVPEKPLTLFREGFDAIAKEPVTEVTWKLAVALGKEFLKRGQGERAKECFIKARLVLRFFLAQFTSSGLKNSYLMADDKERILAALDSHLNM